MVIIWPLREKLGFQSVFLQQRPKSTGGLRIPVLPVLPWNEMDRPPVYSFGQVRGVPNAASTLPGNFAQVAANLVPILPTNLKKPPYSAGTSLKYPAVIHELKPLPARFYMVKGVSRDNNGNVLTNCTVKLFETGTDARIQTTVSDGSGYFYFQVSDTVKTYYLMAYKTGSPDVMGASVNTLTGS